MEKTLHYTNGSKSVDIEVTLKEGRLSICGTVYTGTKLLKSERNLISAGQCLDECRDIIPPQLATVWDQWHLNDMKAGTKAQELLLEPVRDSFNRLKWYEEACEYLKSLNMYEHNGYRYGSAWLKEELPASVVEYISTL